MSKNKTTPVPNTRDTPFAKGDLKAQRKKRMGGVRATKMRQQRQIMIKEAIRLGAFDNRKQVKDWMKTELHLDEPLSEVSTEYSLTDNQLKLWYIWLRYFTGQGSMPRRHVARSKAGPRRLYRIEKLKEVLGWSDANLVGFIERQTGKPKMPQSLYSNEASKVITGMDKILAEQPFKRKHQLKDNE